MRRFLTAAAIVAVVLVGPAVHAGAQEITDDTTAVAPVASLELSAFTVLVITSLLIPVATGIASRWIHSTTGLQIFTAAVSGISGAVTTSTQLDGTAVVSLATLQYALLAFLVATAGYLGIYRPHNANAKLAGS